MNQPTHIVTEDVFSPLAKGGKKTKFLSKNQEVILISVSGNAAIVEDSKKQRQPCNINQLKEINR